MRRQIADTVCRNTDQPARAGVKQLKPRLLVLRLLRAAVLHQLRRQESKQHRLEQRPAHGLHQISGKTVLQIYLIRSRDPVRGQRNDRRLSAQTVFLRTKPL